MANATVNREKILKQKHVLVFEWICVFIYGSHKCVCVHLQFTANSTVILKTHTHTQKKKL